MDSKIFKNYFYNAIFQIYNMIIPLITIPYITKALTISNYGIYSYTTSITQWFVILGMLGITIYGSKTIAHNSSDNKRLSKAFWGIYKLQFITTTISVGLFIILNIKYNYMGTLIFQLPFLLATVIDISWLYSGIEEFKYVTLRNIFVKTLVVICIFIFVKEPSDLPLYIVLNGIANLGGNIFMWTRVSKIVKYEKVGLSESFTHFRGALGLFIPQIATSVYLLLDKTLLGILTTSTEVGIYDQAQRFVKIGLIFVSTFSTVMLPRMAKNFANNNDKETKSGLILSFRFVIIVASVLFYGIIICSYDFINFFLGSEYREISNLMMISSPIVLLIAMGNVSGQQYLVPRGKVKIFTLSVITAALVNATLNFLLIPSLGGVGATIATILAEVSVVVIQYYSFIKYIQENIFIYLFKYLLLGIPIIIVNLLFIYGSNSFVMFIVRGMSVVAGYIIMLIITKDVIIMKFFNKVRDRKHTIKN